MAAPVRPPQETCSKCSSPLSAAMRFCPTCQTDAGAPNVRACRTHKNRKALAVRFGEARKRARLNGCSKEFRDLWFLVKRESNVVVTMAAGVARNLLDDPGFLYTNYEQLVGNGMRKPMGSDSDCRRWGVTGTLFGAVSKKIINGVLSLTGEGLPTYGGVHCRLRDVTINERTSFLETNSYRFVEDHQILAGGDIPAGYRACWKHRHSLALAKLADNLSAGQSKIDWQTILVRSDGKTKRNDDFVEAHIYEAFDKNAIESLTPFPGKKLSKAEKMDLDIAIDKFNSFRGRKK